MQSKLLIICGPTSTGKTSLGLSLAKKFNGEILSADSRQVYRGMDIGTGKDLPGGARLKTPWFKNFGYYETGAIRVWGYDLADPKRDFSVAQYLKFADKIIADIKKRGKLPIVIGGTGLYIKAVVDGIPTAEIPRNESLRKHMGKKKAEELFEILARLDPIRAGGMNASDRQNPRRLIRAVEVATSNKKLTVDSRRLTVDSFFIGLTAPPEILFSRINTRVEKRVNEGVEEEVKKLLKRGVKWNSQAMTSMGYGVWKDYFEGKITKEELINKWVDQEKGYTRRQLVWFKKDKRVIWFNATEKNFQKKVEKTAEKWYIRP